jgi:hypothetical protein
MLKFLMYEFWTKEFRIETGTKICLHSPKCVDEVFEAQDSTPTWGGGGS